MAALPVARALWFGLMCMEAQLLQRLLWSAARLVLGRGCFSNEQSAREAK